MASFQTKIGQKWMRNRENENFSSISFLPDQSQKISKKKGKKFKKLKHTITASFQAKMGWKSSTNGENKNYHSVSF